MKKIIFSVIIAFVVTRAALSSEYREFTSQDGRSMLARIVQYDAAGKRVQLELKNLKKAWVQLSALSKADQDYIRQYDQERAKANPAPPEKLSKKQLRAIGEQYIEAWKSGDIEEVKAFFHEPERIAPDRFNNYQTIIEKFKITKVGDGCIRFEARRRKGKMWRHYTDMHPGFDERWFFFTPDGQIKYDSVILKHPVQIAQDAAYALFAYNRELGGQYHNPEKFAANAYTALEQTGVPLFGLDLSNNTEKINKSLLMILRWLREEGDQWDSSEPNVFFPQDLLRP